MLHIIKKNLQSYLPKANDKPSLLIVGLSGGPDSLFLLHVLKRFSKELPITIHAAHLDHGWRKESADDAKFCKQVCKALDVPITIAHAKDLQLDVKYNGSQEEIGRKLRRHFFTTLKKQLDADYVLLAHQLQDQQETFFIRLLRGSSLSGLVAMKQKQGFYLRPLLSTNKADIFDYLHTHNIQYLTDSSNNSDKHLRNRIRKYIIPACKQCDSRFDQKFQDTLKHLDDAEGILDAHAKNIFFSIFTDTLCGDKTSFLQLSPSMQKRILIIWLNKHSVPYTPSNGFLEEIIRFIKGDNGGTHMISNTWNITKKGTKFQLNHSR